MISSIMSRFSGLLIFAAITSVAAQPAALSPTAIVAFADGKTLYVACGTGNRVLGCDIESQKISSIAMPLAPFGLALSADGLRLYVTCGGPEGFVAILKMVDGRWHQLGTIQAGHTPMAPVISADGKMLYVCNRFDNDVSVIDLGNPARPAVWPRRSWN